MELIVNTLKFFQRIFNHRFLKKSKVFRFFKVTKELFDFKNEFFFQKSKRSFTKKTNRNTIFFQILCNNDLQPYTHENITQLV